jgi:hypothetical protein
MKKIFAILAIMAATSAMADSVTLEHQSANSLDSTDQKSEVVTVKHDFNKNFAGDVSFTNTQTDKTNALSTRLETGLTATQPLFGSVSGYVRAAAGQKFKNTEATGYYSVEPGVTAPLTEKLSARFGYRFRQATSDAIADTTHTARVGLSYALTKTDAVGVRFDRVRGDTMQDITVVNYVHSF